MAQSSGLDGAPLEPEPGAVLLSADLAERIRALLLKELEASGGKAALRGLEEPGLPEEERRHEGNLRAALELLRWRPNA